jgi:general stress protein YciG
MATSDRGLGSPNMDPQKKKEIQRKGGQASHDNQYTTDED